MDLKLKNKTVVVTGGASGIGEAVALAFAKEGSRVAVCDYSQDNLEKVKEIFRRQRLSVITGFADVCDRESLDSFAEEVVKDTGGIDIWINNAGQIRNLSVLEQSEHDWDIVTRTNMTGTFNGTSVAAKHMKNNGGGVIINSSSFAAKRTAVYRSSYAASKAAIESLTRSSAGELAPFGIRVNAVAPGSVARQMPSSNRSKEELEQVLDIIAQRRMAELEEIANVYLFLGSEVSSYVNGTVIDVDGGKFAVQNPKAAWQEVT